MLLWRLLYLRDVLMFMACSFIDMRIPLIYLQTLKPLHPRRDPHAHTRLPWRCPRRSDGHAQERSWLALPFGDDGFGLVLRMGLSK